MELLTGERIVRVVLDYVRQSLYPHAVLIDGDWGSGKTYFLRKQLIPEIEQLNTPGSTKKNSIHYRVVYISLYGISSPEEISRQIVTQVLSYTKPAKAARKAAPAVTQLAGFGLKLAAGITGSAGLEAFNEAAGNLRKESLFGSFINLNRYVFVFDDLERCTIPIHLALGYISNMVESDDIKVIVAANEKEIAHLQARQNLEQKYLLAAQTSIDFGDGEKTETQKKDKKEKTLPLPGKEKLDARVEKLFSEDATYRRIREKLFGITLHYQPELKNIALNLVGKCFPPVGEPAKPPAMLLEPAEMAEVCAAVLDNENHNNLRTVLAALQIYGRLDSLFRKAKIEYRYGKGKEYSQQQKRRAAKGLLHACLRSAVTHAHGCTMPSWKTSAAFTLEDTSKKYSSGIYQVRFEFLDLYFFRGVYLEETVQQILVSYAQFAEQLGMESSNPLRKLRRCELLEDDEIEQELEKLYGYLFQGGYPPEQFESVLYVLADLEYLGFNTKIDDCFKEMDSRLRNGYSMRYYPDAGIESYPKEVRDTVANYSILLEKCSASSILNRLDINSLLVHKPRWVHNLEDAIEQWVQLGFDEYSLFDDMNIELCVECLMQSTNEELDHFRAVLREYYEHHWFRNDIEMLKKLADAVARVDPPKRMQKWQLKWLAQDIECIIAELQKTLKDMD